MRDIVGGQPAAPGQFPWMAAVLIDGRFQCGGALTERDWVLTAAHCVQHVLDAGRTPSVSVDIGGSSPELSIRIRGVSRVLLPDHPELHDLALLQLNTPVDDVEPLPRARHVGPIREDTGSSTATVMGWGDSKQPTRADGRELRWVTLPIVPSAACVSLPGYDEGSWFCAGDAAGGRDACQGDSGGPVITADAGASVQQIGIVSFGDGCAQPGVYAAYTSIPAHADWIDACISGSPTCGSLPACWDRDRDERCSEAEDLQGDGACDRRDCDLALPDGISALVAVSSGKLCESGGQRLASGHDEDADGRLSEAEILASRLTCDPPDPFMRERRRVDDASCLGGHAWIEWSGQDADGNGALGWDEVVVHEQVCEGQPSPPRDPTCSMGAVPPALRSPSFGWMVAVLLVWRYRTRRRTAAPFTALARVRRPPRDPPANGAAEGGCSQTP